MKLLFVCLGNICRSPTAEEIMRQFIKRKGLQDKISCDSAGTSDWHEGQLPDKRMIAYAKERGYHLTSRSRPVVGEDFKNFDLILAMDDENFQNLQALRKKINSQFDRCAKIEKISDYCRKHQVTFVPDPYYGGEEGFKHVIDILEDGCENLLSEIEKKEGSF